MYLEEGIGSTTIAKELNLSSNKRVLLWVKDLMNSEKMD